LLAIGLAVVLAACAKNASDKSSGAAASSGSETSSNPSTGTSQEPTIVTGTLVVETESADGTTSRLPASGAVVYLEGFGDSPGKTATAGRFSVEIPPAAFADSEGAALIDQGVVTWGASHEMEDGSYRAIRQAKVMLQRGEENALGEVVLKLAVTVTGVLEMDGAADASGASFLLPGTPFKTLTDADGRYTLSGVPAGDWPGALATHELYGSMPFEPWSAAEGETYTMPTVTMKKKD
jgi:hypothetical protein